MTRVTGGVQSRALLPGLLRLVAVTDDTVLAGRMLVPAVEAAVRGGATMVQLRLKRATPRGLAEVARQLLRSLTVPIIINDRVDVALAVGAAGVHLGSDDLPPHRVRAVAPPGFVIGVSVGSVEEAAAVGGSADYWGVGPLRPSGTKRDAGAALGVEGFRRLAEMSGGCPCVAIGGVRPEDVDAVAGAGGAGVAVVSGIFAAADIEAGARSYWAALTPR